MSMNAVTPVAVTPVEQAGARRGAGVLLEILRSEGVQYVFGNPGTTRSAADRRSARCAGHQLHLGFAGGECRGHGRRLRPGGASRRFHQPAHGRRLGPWHGQSAQRQCLGHAACRHGGTAGLAPYHHGSAAVRRSRADRQPCREMGAGSGTPTNSPSLSGAPFTMLVRLRPDRSSSRCRWMSWRR